MTATFQAGGGNCPAIGLPGLCGATQIATQGGNIPVEWLRPGDLVLTRDTGYLPLLWIGPGSMTGPDSPTVHLPGPHLAAPALRLATGHGILVTDPALLARNGTAEALISAGEVTGALPVPTQRGAELYFHLLLGSHEIILADGVWVESLAASEITRCLPAGAMALAGPLLRQVAMPVRPRINRSDLHRHIVPVPSGQQHPPGKNRSFRVA